MNPYYIPRRRSPMLDLADLGLRLYGIKQRGDISKQKLSLEERQLKGEQFERKIKYGTPSEFGAGYTPEGASPERYGTTGTVQRGLEVSERLAGLRERQVGIQEDEAERLRRTQLAQFNKHMADKPSRANLMMLAKRDPYLEKGLNNILSMIDENPDMTRWDAYYALKPQEATYIADAKEKLEPKILAAIKAGKVNEAKVLEEKYNALRPGFLENFFGFPKDYMREERAMDIEIPTKLTETPAQKLQRDKDLAVYKTTLVKPTPEKTERGFEEKVAAAEANILGEKLKPEQKKPWVNYFNRYSNINYCYIITKGKEIKWGKNIAPNIKRIDLPKKDGKQITATEVYFTAQKHGISYEEVLKRLKVIK